MVTLMGGRTAEQITFDDISTGAHNDLARATDIAQNMVREYGMSEKIGQVYYARKKKAQFLVMLPEGACEFSDTVGNAIDQEVKGIIGKQYERALEILRGNIQILEKGTRILLKKENIDAAEIQVLITQ